MAVGVGVAAEADVDTVATLSEIGVIVVIGAGVASPLAMEEKSNIGTTDDGTEAVTGGSSAGVTTAVGTVTAGKQTASETTIAFTSGVFDI